MSILREVLPFFVLASMMTTSTVSSGVGTAIGIHCLVTISPSGTVEHGALLALCEVHARHHLLNLNAKSWTRKFTMAELRT